MMPMICNSQKNFCFAMKRISTRRSGHRHARLPKVLISVMFVISCVSSRMLQQSSGDTADQLVSDGSDSPPVQACLCSSISSQNMMHMPDCRAPLGHPKAAAWPVSCSICHHKGRQVSAQELRQPTTVCCSCSSCNIDLLRFRL